MWIHQLLRNGKWISHDEIQQKFKLGKMRYNSIKSAVSRVLRKENTASTNCLYDSVKVDRNVVSTMYNKLGEHQRCPNRVTQLWMNAINCDMDEIYTQFRRIYMISNVPKLRSFHYRMLHRALVFNSHLFRWKMKDSNQCERCKSEKETFDHALYGCPLVKEFWRQVSEFTKSEYGISLNTSMRCLLWCDQRKNKILDFICLLAIQFIYVTRCKSEPLNIGAFKRYISTIRNVEKFIAVKNNCLSKHNAKWGLRSDEQLTVEEFIEQYNLRA